MTPIHGPVLTERVRDRLDARVRPLLQAHGGEIELVDVSRGAVTLRFAGACTGCPLRSVTLVVAVEPELRRLEGVETVSALGVRVSRHAAARLATAFSHHLPGGGRTGSVGKTTGDGEASDG